MPEIQIHPTMLIGTWNTQWKKPGGEAGTILRERLKKAKCDVLCVTEGFAKIFPDHGHVIDAGRDWGYKVPEGAEGRRKVLLWSERPWTPHPCARGSAELPNGRFVAGSTETPSGECLTVVGVCIPWSGAHVTTGRKNRVRWQDHAAWLWGFAKLRSQFPLSRTVVLGDFNQKIPKIGTSVPQYIHDALMHGFEGFRFATKGDLAKDRLVRDSQWLWSDEARESWFAEVPKLSIDHIAHSPDLARKGIGIWPKQADDGAPLSDHFGVWGDFQSC